MLQQDLTLPAAAVSPGDHRTPLLAAAAFSSCCAPAPGRAPAAAGARHGGTPVARPTCFCALPLC